MRVIRSMYKRPACESDCSDVDGSLIMFDYSIARNQKEEERLSLKFRFERELTETEMYYRKNSISNMWRAINIEKEENLGRTDSMYLALAMDIIDQWLLAPKSNRCAAVADSAILLDAVQPVLG